MREYSEVQQCESCRTVQWLSIVRQMGSKTTGHQSVPVLPDTVDKRMYSPRGTLCLLLGGCLSQQDGCTVDCLLGDLVIDTSDSRDLCDIHVL